MQNTNSIQDVGDDFLSDLVQQNQHQTLNVSDSEEENPNKSQNIRKASQQVQFISNQDEKSSHNDEDDENNSINSDDSNILAKLKKKQENLKQEDMNQDFKVNERRKTAKQSQQNIGQTQIKEELPQEVQNRDMFESTDYKAFFDTSVTEQYEDFVYLISRGKFEEVIQQAEELNIQVDEYLRPTGDNIMHVCAEYGQIKLFQYFFDKGGNVLSVNHADEQPIHVAAREGKVDMIRHIIENHRALISVDCVMSDNWTPFFYSAVNGYLITVEVLAKEYNCNINHLDKFNRSALHWAARYNNRAMVKKLLDLGINIELKDMEELTAFELAKQHGGYEVAQLIGQHQVKIQKELERKYGKDSKKVKKVQKQDPTQ
eukprot:403367319